MITAKIFKVNQITTNSGRQYYRVIGYDNKFNYFIGLPSFNGSLENKTFTDALDQIDTVINHSVKSEKTVHVVFAKNNSSSKEKKVKNVR